ncbi:MAG: MarR family transcriptional regulator [Candidatus Limnocylindrales bacterium]
MPLNINETPTDPPVPNPAESESTDQQRLAAAVRDELLSWNPREFISAFRRWHHGAFSLIHLNVLTMLETEGPLSMSHLAEALDVSVASTTGIVDRMEKRGLVERRHEVTDRRVVLVYPTEAGRDVFRDIDERRRVGLGKMLERLTADELDGLLKGHRALRLVREAAATRAANGDASQPPETGSAAPATPSRLHRASTIARDDSSIEPVTGASR